MTLGERIKTARNARGLSLRALSEEVGVSAMAISKYERDLDVPGSDVLLRLAQALGVKVEFFFRQQEVQLSEPAYRKRTTLPRKQEQVVLAQVREWLERYLETESFFDLEGIPKFSLPDAAERLVASLEDVEDVAIALREEWGLGLDPVESMVELLEDHGIKVGLGDGHDKFDACTIWANQTIPVIVVKRDIPGDRQRFNLAHELGHMVLEPDREVDEEKAAYRFAGAFLVPESKVRFELGAHRDTLNLYELHLLKHKYGLSMQGWIYRARDLGILSESAARRLFVQFRREGWHRKEPGEQLPPEEPRRMQRLVLRALAEDMISQSRGAELLGKPMPQFYREEAGEHDGFPAVAGVRS
jgi:Zn-dependent peptidase ImmA (M78 family)/DNA-binding XRE family transcriptional regulator